MAIVKAGSEFLVNTFTTKIQSSPTVTALSDGGFVITWQSLNQVSSEWSYYDIYAQLYAADGSKVGSEFRVNTYTTDFQINPSVAALSDGGFVITWMSSDQVSGTSQYDIYAQRYKADGRKAAEYCAETTL